eukprot:jgi/Orpsp1_1/1188347/evm.model.d7180000064036.1
MKNEYNRKESEMNTLYEKCEKQESELNSQRDKINKQKYEILSLNQECERQKNEIHHLKNNRDNEVLFSITNKFETIVKSLENIINENNENKDKENINKYIEMLEKNLKKLEVKNKKLLEKIEIHNRRDILLNRRDFETESEIENNTDLFEYSIINQNDNSYGEIEQDSHLDFFNNNNSNIDDEYSEEGNTFSSNTFINPFHSNSDDNGTNQQVVVGNKNNKKMKIYSIRFDSNSSKVIPLKSFKINNKNSFIAVSVPNGKQLIEIYEDSYENNDFYYIKETFNCSGKIQEYTINEDTRYIISNNH